MDGMTLFAVCALCTAHPVALSGHPGFASPQIAEWEAFIDEAAQRFAIPQDWIRSVMAAESRGRTTLHGRPITSPKGAMGLMQVMPSTYGDLRRRYDLGANSYDPHDNILAGTAYLREMYERYGYPFLFAAYNAGPRRVDDYLLRGIPLPGETKDYVTSILPGTAGMLFGDDRRSGSVGESPGAECYETKSSTLFFVSSKSDPATRSDAKSPQAESISRSLFVARGVAIAATTGVQNSQLFVPLSADSSQPNRR